MAKSRSRRQPTPRPEKAAPRRVRLAHKSKGNPVSKGVNWDRLPGNWLTLILILMAVLYVPPLKGLYEQRQATAEAKVTLQQLGKENRELKTRARELKKESSIATEARKLGMVSPDEKPFVVIR
jgi:hypothetical protein